MGRMVEIDEEELLRNQKLRETVTSILAHPVAKLKVQEATKLVYPNARTPELDAARESYKADEAIVSKFSELERKMDEDKAAREGEARMRALTEKYEKGFTKLREQGFTDAGIAEVRKIMEEKGILDHDVAAAFYEKQNPPQPPLTPNGRGGWGFMEGIRDEDSDLKQLIASKGENNGLIDKMAHDALKEVRATGQR